MTPHWARRLSLLTFKRYLSRSSRPILVGPWHSELGFEVLYWEPFVAWLLDGVKKERITGVTRGGAPLYPAHVDVFQFLSPRELRAHTYRMSATQQSIKQYRVQPWERRLMERVTDHLQLSARPIWVHPSLMYRFFDDFWKDRAGLSRILPYTQYRPLQKPPKMDGLPDRYYTVRFYSRSTFPLSPDHRRLAETIVTGLLNRAPVVCLNTPESFDDHIDLPLERRDGVLVISDADPTKNLAIQLSAIAHSMGFVGPYGGLQQAALRYQVPSLGLFMAWSGTMMAHRFLSEYIAAMTGVPFTVQRTTECGCWSPVWDQLSSNVGKAQLPAAIASA